MAEQGVVVGHPVKRGGRQDRVHGRLEGQRLAEVRNNEFDTVAVCREPLPRLSDHRRRGVQRDHPSGRQSRKEVLRDAAGPAARVENPFRAGQRKAIDDVAPPACLRSGDSIVCGCIPLSHRASQLEGKAGAARHQSVPKA